MNSVIDSVVNSRPWSRRPVPGKNGLRDPGEDAHAVEMDDWRTRIELMLGKLHRRGYRVTPFSNDPKNVPLVPKGQQETWIREIHQTWVREGARGYVNGPDRNLRLRVEPDMRTYPGLKRTKTAKRHREILDCLRSVFAECGYDLRDPKSLKDSRPET